MANIENDNGLAQTLVSLINHPGSLNFFKQHYKIFLRANQCYILIVGPK